MQLAIVGWLQNNFDHLGLFNVPSPIKLSVAAATELLQLVQECKGYCAF